MTEEKLLRGHLYREKASGRIVVYLHYTNWPADVYGERNYHKCICITDGNYCGFYESNELEYLKEDMKVESLRAPDDSHFPQKSDYSQLKNEAQYINELLSGREEIFSYYSWFNKNLELLNRCLAKPAFMRLKLGRRILELSNIANNLGLKITPSPRYAWIDWII